jgi:CheY-like chemotaxis protein
MNNPGRTAIVVDDEPLLAEVAGWTLEEHGYDVQIANDARSAFDLVRQTARLDLLLTDIRMSGDIDGWGLAQMVREIRPEVPIIYMTGYSPESPGAVLRSIVLRKPFTPDELVAAVRRLDSEPETSPGAR